MTKTPEENYNFYQNTSCPFFPHEDNENACHPESDPDTHNCLYCYCPLYELEPEGCPEDANPKILDNGVKSCENCLYPHKLENYQEIQEILRDREMKRAKERR